MKQIPSKNFNIEKRTSQLQINNPALHAYVFKSYVISHLIIANYSLIKNHLKCSLLSSVH